MANRFQSGAFLPFRWQGPNGLFTIGIRGKSVDFMRLLFDVTNTNHGGLTARISGKFDASGNVTVDFDADQPNFGVPAIQEGVSGIISYGVSSLGAAIQLPVIIEKIHYEDKVEDKFIWNFDFKFNTLAGLLVYPVIL